MSCQTFFVNALLLIESLLLQLVAIAIGACIGSFLNVVIYRVPAGLSILYPPSRCPHCLRKLAPRDNIPIIGWFLIRGKCRYCHTPVSWRYPAIEALTAFLFWCVVAYFGASQSVITLGFYAAFLSWLLALSMIDLDTMTLPNSLTQSGLVLGFIYQGSLAFTNTSDPTNFAGHLINGVFGAFTGLCSLQIMIFLAKILLYIVVILIVILGFLIKISVLESFKYALVTLIGKIESGDGMGVGDFKLMSMIGVWLGWQNILFIIVFSSAMTVFIGLIGKLVGKIGRFTEIPYGISISIGAALCLFFGDVINSNYIPILRSIYRSIGIELL